MQDIRFDYFRGMEAEQYSFYRVPKVLYGLMLDRMSLSVKNKWFDEADRVYIIFTVEEIADLMNCGTQKAVKLVKELDADKGIGLIEKKRLGLGRPNVIYVKNFMIKDDSEESRTDEKPQDSAGHNSRMMKTTIQEFPKSPSNNTEFNNTDLSETAPINPYPSDVIDKMDRYRATIRRNISYECFRGDRSCQMEELDELVELMVDVMMMSDCATLRVAGSERPAVVVKEHFMKLDHSHMVYATSCLRRNSTKVENIKAYLLAALYNAPMTIDNYYRADVNHDMYGSG